MDLIFQPIEIKDLPQVLTLFKQTAEKINAMQVDHWQYWKQPPREKVQWVEEGISNKENNCLISLALNS